MKDTLKALGGVALCLCSLKELEKRSVFHKETWPSFYKAMD